MDGNRIRKSQPWRDEQLSGLTPLKNYSWSHRSRETCSPRLSKHATP